jgi:hypothetical protein
MREDRKLPTAGQNDANDPERSSANSKHISWVGIPHRSAGLPRGHVSAVGQRALAVLNERRHYSSSALISKEGARNLTRSSNSGHFMRRRDVLGLLGSAIVSCPFRARAQQTLPVIGFLNGGSPTFVPMGGRKIRPLACDGRGACGPQCPSNCGQHSCIKARPSCHEDGRSDAS